MTKTAACGTINSNSWNNRETWQRRNKKNSKRSIISLLKDLKRMRKKPRWSSKALIKLSFNR